MRVTGQAAKDLEKHLESQGIATPKKKRTSKVQPKLSPVLFVEMCKRHGLPRPEPEVVFCHGRKWAFDWLFRLPMPGAMDGIYEVHVAVEIQGGLFSGGRHTRGAALLAEYEKLNTAQIMGYKVLLFTPQQVKSGEAFPIIHKALYGD